MNIVKELRKKKGIQQKELAITIGVSRPTVCEWEANKKDPSGERLKKLAKFFGVDELTILGRGIIDLTKADQQISLKTDEAKIISTVVDCMPQVDREKALNVLKAVYAEYFKIVEEKDA